MPVAAPDPANPTKCSLPMLLAKRLGPTYKSQHEGHKLNTLYMYNYTASTIEYEYR